MSNITFDFSNAKLLVVGDVLLDKYYHGQTSRISPEAPVPVVNVVGQESRPGGAANVALNLKSLGANVSLQGCVGDDEGANTLRGLLLQKEISTHFHTLNAPTIVKIRALSRHQQLLRLDFEQNFAEFDLTPLIVDYKKMISKHQVVVLSDYGKGTLTSVSAFIDAAVAKNIPVIIDPKGTDFAKYRQATLLTPNMSEFQAVVGECNSNQLLEEKGRQLLKSLSLRALLITRGEKGMTLIEKNNSTIHLPAYAKEVYDVTGAGDTVIATLSAAIASGHTFYESAKLANLAASIVVGKLGTATISGNELSHAVNRTTPKFPKGIVDEKRLQQIRQELFITKKRLVFTNGCFDLLHPGHVAYLRQAKALGDYLVVAVNDDDSVKRLKGNTRPINNVQSRMTILSALAAVDWVVPFSEDTPLQIISVLKPDVLVKGGDYKISTIVGADIVTKAGGEVKIIDFVQGYSTTATVNKMQLENNKETLC